MFGICLLTAGIHLEVICHVAHLLHQGGRDLEHTGEKKSQTSSWHYNIFFQNKDTL